MELSPRLKKIASLIPAKTVLADIGTDHAYIPTYCFENNICTFAYAMDVNKGPLERAMATLKKFGYEHKAELRLSNGLDKLNKDEADVIVIAGMGGLLIRDILEKGKDVVSENTLLLLQPMIAPIELRDWLFSNGFNIENEYVVREENKYYNIFSVRKGKSIINDYNRFIGINLYKNSHEIYNDYLKFKIRICDNIISGMKKSDNPDYVLLEKYIMERQIYLDNMEV